MAKNVSSKFDLNEGLFDGTAVKAEKPAVADLTALISPSAFNEPVVEVRSQFGHTQGRKGQKAKRITMAFSDDNHEYITYESRRRGMSATAFVNMVLDKYKELPEGHCG